MRKKVSWASLAGCCWGWKRASKFQNELSMKLLVGISENLKMVSIDGEWRQYVHIYIMAGVTRSKIDELVEAFHAPGAFV